MSSPAPAAAPHEIDLTAHLALESVAIPPPADWVARVAEVAAFEGMAPLRMAPGDAWQSGGRWVLHPWWLMHDATALLLWAEHLDDDTPVSIWRTPRQQGGITVHGQLAGYPTALIGHSFRLDIDVSTRAPHALTLDALRRLAADEGVAVDTAPLSGPPRSASLFEPAAPAAVVDVVVGAPMWAAP